MNKTVQAITSAGLMVLILTGCDLFTTRTPEEPDTGGSNFITPTSPDIVLLNFATAIRELNEANYLRCLVAREADSSGGSARFNFDPSAEAAQRFGTLFSGWTLESERKAFVSMAAAIPAQAIPALTLNTGFNEFEIVSPDSVVYISTYTFTPGMTEQSQTVSYSGRMTLTLSRLPNSTWACSRWTDQSVEIGGSTAETWSTLKATYAD